MWPNSSKPYNYPRTTNNSMKNSPRPDTTSQKIENKVIHQIDNSPSRTRSNKAISLTEILLQTSKDPSAMCQEIILKP